MRITFNNLFSTKELINSINQYFDQLDTSIRLVSEGECDLEIIPLHLLPTERNSSKTVFGLITLAERRNFIAIRNDVVNINTPIGLPYSAIINVSPLFVSKNLLEIRGDVQLEVLEPLQIIEGLRKNDLEIAIVEGCFINEEIASYYKLIPLDGREFGHFPGQGFLAIVGNKDLAIGNILRKLNKRESVIPANIERKLMTLVDYKVNNHCEMDIDGNFHFWVHAEKGSAQVSQSTRNEIEDKIKNKLDLLS
ncbi:hypothetical protein [Portibacter lacus]|uniref:Uncharacterized protein n=1 Tax=Portibacter lacus TaxID=1099794 RepID=A0AA37WF04_9BACT|nr:hypothetical protein [Portibacter lacus]GLR19376.1 hypothetical protein GCM10007940_39920 [Portibacter lacus]